MMFFEGLLRLNKFNHASIGLTQLFLKFPWDDTTTVESGCVGGGGGFKHERFAFLKWAAKLNDRPNKKKTALDTPPAVSMWRWY